MPYQGPLNKNNTLSQASALNIEVAPTSLTTTLSLFKKIYKQLTLLVVYRLNPLAIALNFLRPSLVLYLVSTTYKDKAITDIL